MYIQIKHQLKIPEELSGLRLDQAIAKLLPDYSRSCLKSWILRGEVLVDQVKWRPRDKVFGNEQIDVNAFLVDHSENMPEDIPIDVIAEDEDILIINKSANMVVHPAAGNWQGTLVNALLYYCPSLKTLPRAGLVHRIDKDTTGLLLVAKNLTAYNYLVKQLQKHEIDRQYVAIVYGQLTGGGKITQPIGRDPRNHTRMSVVKNGKFAVTHYRILERFPRYTYIQINLETGRTHQIRVHMAHNNYPIVGDPVYSRRRHIVKGSSTVLYDFMCAFNRQALHARSLAFIHPTKNIKMKYQADVPKDFQNLLYLLRQEIN